MVPSAYSMMLSVACTERSNHVRPSQFLHETRQTSRVNCKIYHLSRDPMRPTSPALLKVSERPTLWVRYGSLSPSRPNICLPRNFRWILDKIQDTEAWVICGNLDCRHGKSSQVHVPSPSGSILSCHDAVARVFDQLHVIACLDSVVIFCRWCLPKDDRLERPP